MGYLAVSLALFVVGFVLNAVALALLSQSLYGTVEGWVGPASLVIGCASAWIGGQWYDNWSGRAGR